MRTQSVLAAMAIAFCGGCGADRELLPDSWTCDQVHHFQLSQPFSTDPSGLVASPHNQKERCQLYYKH